MKKKKIMKGRGKMEGREGKREGGRKKKEGGRRTESRGEGSTGQRAYKYVGDLQSRINVDEKEGVDLLSFLSLLSSLQNPVTYSLLYTRRIMLPSA